MRRLLTYVTLLLIVAAIFPLPTAAGAGPEPTSVAVHRFRHEQQKAIRLGAHGRAVPTEVVANRFRVLGHIRLLSKEVHADVAFYDYGHDVGKFAFIGSWGARCAGTGVKIIDVNHARYPFQVSVAGSHAGESHEDMDVVRIGGRTVMVVGVQPCGKKGRTGIAMLDVSDPSHPSRISFFRTPGGGVHELDVVQRRGGRTLALLAVPFVEFGNTYFGGNDGGEFRIVDITHPALPREISTWGIIADSSLPIFGGRGEITSSFQGLGPFAAHFAHSVRGADHGMTAYVSYWDGGVLKLDISDPANPQLLARTTFPLPADGDAHSMTPFSMNGHRFVLQNDEDGNPFTPFRLTSTATSVKQFLGIEEPWAPTKLTETGPISGHVFDAGDGCQATDFAGAKGKIVLADTVDPFYENVIDGWPAPPCKIGRQTIIAARAGAVAFVSNLISPDDAFGFFTGNFDNVQEAARGMPVVQISDIDGEADRIREVLAHRSVRVALLPSRPTHGFLRVFREDVGQDANDDGVFEMRQIGRFKHLPHVAGSAHPPAGWWEIHNTEVRGRRAYSSWYSHGIVALAIGHPRDPRLVGQFVPPASSRFKDIFGRPYPLVWGVAIDPETGIVYASDMRSGLWIVRPKRQAAS